MARVLESLHPDEDAAMLQARTLTESSSEPPEAFFLGAPDGSCPDGSTRVQIDECRTLGGQTLNGRVIQNAVGAVRDFCKTHFPSGPGCFFSGSDNFLRSTSSNCPVANGGQCLWPVCKGTAAAPPVILDGCGAPPPTPAPTEPSEEFFLGAQDGSCPGGSTRVQIDECRTLGGQTLNGRVIQNAVGAVRDFCKPHFPSGPGCFFSGSDNFLRSPSSNCPVANGGQCLWPMCKGTPAA